MWLGSTLLSLAVDCMSDSLKALLPSSKKKKKSGGNTGPYEELQALMINPMRQALKDLSQYYSTNFTRVTPEWLGQREEYLEHEQAKLGDLLAYPAVASMISKKAKEIVKEEKLQRERLRDLAGQVSKRFKDLASSGVFA